VSCRDITDAAARALHWFMDPLVLAAMAKWPQVPAVYGWLRLTARGQWLIRGEPIQLPALRAFIDRNYAADAQGRWYFQNGPQRVFVSLDVAPWIWRVLPAPGGSTLVAHTGAPVHELRGAWLDSRGRIFVLTELGIGLVDSTDAGQVMDALASGGGAVSAAQLEAVVAGRAAALSLRGARLGLNTTVDLLPLDADAVAQQFGFVPQPRPRQQP
jgi:hypothetical protein